MEGATEFKEIVVGPKGFSWDGRVRRRRGKRETIGSLVWGLVEMFHTYLFWFCNKQLQTERQKTILFSSGILWVRNLDRAQRGWLLCSTVFGPSLGKFQWLRGDIISSGT